MTITTEILESVLLAADTQPQTDSKGVWIQLAKSGTFRGHSAGPFTLDGKVFSDIVRNFKASANKRIPIDFEHASESDATDGSIPHTGAPAQGWILDLDNRGEELWGLVQWLEPARTYVKEEKYKFFSPAIRFGSKDRVTGAPIGARMSSGALTNNPFLDGMKPMVAKDAAATENTEGGTSADEAHEAQKEIAMNLEADLKAAKAELETATVKMKVGEEKALTLTAQNAELSLKLKESDAKIVTLTNDLAIANKSIDERDSRDAAAKVDAAYLTYKDTKGLKEADKADMAVFLKASPDAFARMYPAVPADKQHLLRSLTEKRETVVVASGGDDGNGNDGRKPTSVLGLAKVLMRDQKLSYDAAIEKARREFAG